MSNCIVPGGCANLACDPDHGVCIARQQIEAEQGYPEPTPFPHQDAMSLRRVPRYAPEDARVLHAELGKEAAERKVDESRVPFVIQSGLGPAEMAGVQEMAAIQDRASGILPPDMRIGPVYLPPIVTNTPRAGESPEQTAARSPEARAARRMADAVKDSNPKDAIGVLKIALTYVSLPVILEVALGMMEGAFKYGRHNYREAGVRASVYVDATFRHLAAFWEGEDFDPDIQEKCGIDVSHITKAIASLTVLRDSMIRGNWVDDRPPAVKPGWIAKLSGDVKKMAAAYPNPVPPVTEIGLRAKRETVQ